MANIRPRRFILQSPPKSISSILRSTQPSATNSLAITMESSRHLQTAAGDETGNSIPLNTLANAPKTSLFTEFLPPDNLLPSPEISKNAPEELLRRARILQEGLFSYVAPEPREEYKFLMHSPSALHDLGLHPDEAQNEHFQSIMSGQTHLEKPYPYAQAYAGFQFGTWAGQLGDGRVINLFDIKNPQSGKRYEIQIKGGGLTPFSRFADGKAVLRSSIREFLGSEAAHALGIPTSRALAITALPKTVARRERLETCAVVTRMAESWVRFGTFDLVRRQNRGKDVRLLADYVIDKVYGGEDQLVEPHEPLVGKREEGQTEEEFAAKEKENEATSQSRYVRLYREIVRRNAYLLGRCQVYGLLNGVLNTDNTSVLGLSIDYGPFAFMDTFDPSYTPNHDDGHLRYSYRSMPETMWWNLVKLGEDLGLLLGAGSHVDDPKFQDEEGYLNEEYAESVQEQAIAVLRLAEEEYKRVYQATLDDGFRKRLGLVTQKDTDHRDLIKPLLDIFSDGSLDLNQTFRGLGDIALFAEEKLDDGALTNEVKDFYPTKASSMAMSMADDNRRLLVKWLHTYHARLQEEGNTDDAARKARMDAVNPKFVLKNWILQEVIERVERDRDYKILEDVLHMSLNPFQEEWGRNIVDEMRFTGEVPASFRDAVCSCSS